MNIISNALTDVGRKRDHNEDNFYLHKEANLFIVADGMGGHEAGEVASQMIVEAIRDFFIRTGNDPDATWPYKMYKNKTYEENRLIIAIKEGNKKVNNLSKKKFGENTKHGMGTTVTSLLISDGGAYSAWVGDSRIYRFRDDILEQISEDHSLLNEMIKKNDMTQEEIDNFPHKNVILRAVGLKPEVEVDVKFEKLKDGDIYLLCSDGLSGEVEDDEMEEILRKHSSDLEEANKQLIAAANKNGGKDNITSALVKYNS